LIKILLNFIPIIFLFFLSWIIQSFIILLTAIFYSFLTFFFIIKNLLIKNILIVFLSITISILFFELSISIVNQFNKSKFFEISKKNNLHKNKYPDNYKNYNDLFFNNDKNLGYKALPGKYYHQSYFNDEKIFDVSYEIDDQGFRITPQENLSKEKIHINFFGGSFVFGLGLDQKKTLPYFFSQLIDKKKYHVNNYGIPGWGPNTALTLLNQIIIKKKNTRMINVLVFFPAHVYRTSCKVSFSYGTPKYKFKNNKLVKDGKCGLIKNMFLLKILNKSEVFTYIKDYFYQKPVTETQNKIFYEIINEFRKISTEQNHKTFIIILNSMNENDNYKIDETYGNLKFIDLTLFNYEDKDDYELFIINEKDQHPSAYANYRRAIALKEHMFSNE
tara:strand:+ start:111 stop:1277 length:1167 start_codon:yes stop_codon:yes gene_type:complete